MMTELRMLRTLRAIEDRVITMKDAMAELAGSTVS
jgi:hypothetical protein